MHWKVTSLKTMLRGGVRVQSGRAAVCLPAAASGASHWPVGCDSVTGLGAFEYAGTMRDE